jgi:hypothetical protein
MSDPDAPVWPEGERQPDVLTMATAELLDLAAAVRGQHWRDELAPALVAAQSAGWDWPRRARAACLLIFDPSGEPRSLTDASRDPVTRKPERAAPPPEYREARLALERARAGR